MHHALQNAGVICKTLMRNGYDAHIINAPLQEYLLTQNQARRIPLAIDIASEVSPAALIKIFPKAVIQEEESFIATYEENGILYRFYPLNSHVSTHPELSLLRITPSIAANMDDRVRAQMRQIRFGTITPTKDLYEGFENINDGAIRLVGIPDETLGHNYLLAIRALRFAANYDLPIEPNTWMAIVRASVRILDYVPAIDIMDEWRKVSAESLHRFVELLYQTHLLQGFMPEIASLSCVVQQNDQGEINGNVFEHTLKAMELYPQSGMHYDWYGTLAMMFHDVGKLYTAEFFNGRWVYFQHHKVGAQVTRKILRRMHFEPDATDLICHLVNEHMRFHFMMTDSGIRKFMALGETERLIAMSKADLLARNDNFTSYNHNIKYLERAQTPEELLKPLLNGNEIMEVTNLTPGPLVGLIRNTLLNAQRTGEVTNRDEAIKFVQNKAKIL